MQIGIHAELFAYGPRTLSLPVPKPAKTRVRIGSFSFVVQSCHLTESSVK